MQRNYLKILFSFVLITCISAGAFASKYYWVGGSGNWSAFATHWATASGGSTFQVQVPRSIDTVYFDANSFTGNGQTVNVDILSDCADMDWTGATTNYTGSVNGPSMTLNNTLNLWGSLKTVTGMRTIYFGFDQSIAFKSLTTGKTVTTQGVKFRGAGGSYDRMYLSFTSSTGGWTITDSLITDGYIQLVSGALNTNSKVVKCAAFNSNYGNVRSLTMGTSTLTCYGAPTNGGDAWTVNSSNFTLSAASSTIIMSSSANRFFSANSSLTYGRLVINSGTTLMNYGDGAMISFTDVICNASATFEFSMSVSDTIKFNPGCTYTFVYQYGGSWRYDYYFGASSKLIANGSCGKYINITTNLTSGTTTINRTGGNWGTQSVSYCNMEGIICAGGGSLVANPAINLGRNTNVTFTAPASQSYYWVGNSGSWHDGSHWSFTSGGAPSGCVPTALDNVYFDGNSFTAGGKVVSVDTVAAYFNSMDWTGATNTPNFTATNNLNIYGSLTFISAMTTTITGAALFKTTTVSNITSAGQVFKSPGVYFNGTGTYNLMDAFVSAAPAYSDYTNGDIWFNQGTLNTNNNNVTARGWVSNSGLSRTLNFGSSAILINTMSKNWTSWNWNCSGPNLTVNAGTSVITIDNADDNQIVTFVGGGFIYYDVKFMDVNQNAAIDNFTAHSMYCYGSATFTSNDAITNMLLLTGAKDYSFQSGTTLTFSAAATLNANGGCAGLIILHPSAASFASFTKPSGAIVADNVQLTNMHAVGGATYTATNGLDLGGNTGWTITSGTTRTLYWVGGTGNWSDQNHWALSSGGTAGNCPPSLLDNINFDNNSFTSSSKTVSVDVNSAYCKNMTWTNTLHSPIFVNSVGSSLSIYGSMTLCANLSNNYVGAFVFKGTGANTMTCAGRPFAQYASITIDCGVGSLSLNDAVTSYWDVPITVTSGTFNTNNQSVQVIGIYSSGSTTRAINLGTSKLYIYEWRVTPNLYSGTADAAVGLTLNAGTSVMYFLSGWMSDFCGGGLNYYKVVGNPGTSLWIKDNNTFNVVDFYGDGQLTQSNLIIDSLNMASGRTYNFGAGRTQTFLANTYIDVIGAGGSPIHIYSTSAGTQFTWTKPSGRVCADYIYIQDSKVTGGTSWQGGANADNASNNTGWTFNAYPVAESVSIAPGVTTVCPGTTVNMSFTLSKGPGIYPQNYPKEIIFDRLVGGVSIGKDSISVSSNPYTYPVIPGSSITYVITKSYINACFSKNDTIVGGGTTGITVYSGTAGVWAGRTSTDWFDCSNWQDGMVPTNATNVVIPTGLSTYPNIGGAGAVCHDININNGGSLSINNSASTLSVYGNFSLNGVLQHTNGIITMTGSSATALNGTTDYTFNKLEINNTSGVTMNRTVSVNNELRMTAGFFNIGNNTLSLFGVVTGTATLGGNTTSTLNISGSNALGTVYFTAGTSIGFVSVNRFSGTMTLGTPLTISVLGTFNNGNIISSAANYVEFSNNAACSGASDNSYVEGPVRKTGDDVFVFPIGKAGHYHQVAMTAPALTTDYFTAEYFPNNPNTAIGTPKVSTLDHISTCDYWRFDRSATSTASVNLTLSWSNSTCGFWSGVSNMTDLRVAHWDGAQWTDEGNIATTGTNNNGTITSIVESSFSPFALASHATTNPLPIELLSFTAVKDNADVDLKWVTATEVNNDFFTVERSADAVQFEPVLTQIGAGTSSKTNYYSGTDKDPLQGLSYYRLKQTDFDGKYTYSKVISVDFDAISSLALDVFPNPNNGSNINVRFSGLKNDSSVLVVMHDILGKEYYSKVMIGTINGQLDFILESNDQLPKGVYFITASSNDDLLTKKLVIE